MDVRRIFSALFNFANPPIKFGRDAVEVWRSVAPAPQGQARMAAPPGRDINDLLEQYGLQPWTREKAKAGPRKPRGAHPQQGGGRDRAKSLPPCPRNCTKGCRDCMKKLTPPQHRALITVFKRWRQHLENLRYRPPTVGEKVLLKVKDNKKVEVTITKEEQGRYTATKLTGRAPNTLKLTYNGIKSSCLQRIVPKFPKWASLMLAKHAKLSSYQDDPSPEIAYRLRGYMRACDRAKKRHQLADVTEIPLSGESDDDDDDDEES